MTKEILIEALNDATLCEMRNNAPIKSSYSQYSYYPHFITNQSYFGQLNLFLEKNVPSKKITKIRAALLLVSVSISILTALGEYCDVILMYDIDQCVLDNLVYSLTCFRAASTPGEYCHHYFSEEKVFEK